MDVLCQGKAGMGKTAVFVLATLQQIEPVDGQVSVLVMCHTRELAFQISKEYERFSKFLNTIKVGLLIFRELLGIRRPQFFIAHYYLQVGVFFGGMAIAKDEQVLKNNCPHIVVGTPGRILALVKSKKLPLKNLKHFVLDECDKMLEQLGVFSSSLPPTSVLTFPFPVRHEARRAGDLPRHPAREAGHDVLSHPLQGHQTSVQEVHAGPHGGYFPFKSH